jgi:hypothetical protein
MGLMVSRGKELIGINPKNPATIEYLIIWMIKNGNAAYSRL